MREIILIGIGVGDPGHLTLQGVAALQEASLVLLPLKGEEKADLADFRRGLLARHAPDVPVTTLDIPQRDPAIADYGARVADWHATIAARYGALIARAGEDARIALLVWGDPSLYDSTLRLLERVRASGVDFSLRVVPGITALQALTASFAIPLNTIGGPVLVTTGRRLARGWPEGADTVAVMLDGVQAFSRLTAMPLDIWWGAYLGAPEQILISGPLVAVSDEIVAVRAAARARHGWIMDTYLLRRR